MKKIFNVLVVLCAVFAVCALIGCKQPTGPVSVDEWKSATVGDAYYTLTAYDNDTWEMSVTAKTSGVSATLDFAKGTYSGDIGADTGSENEVKISVTDLWDVDAEDWKPVPGTLEAKVEIKGKDLTIPSELGLPVTKFTKQ